MNITGGAAAGDWDSSLRAGGSSLVEAWGRPDARTSGRCDDLDFFHGAMILPASGSSPSGRFR
jgi:hypothetical protein